MCIRNSICVVVLGALTMGFATVGCGESVAPDQVVHLDAAADGSLRFARSSLQAAPGRVAVEMTNPSSIPHAIGIRGPDVGESGQTVASGGRSRVEAQLKPGRYTLFCPVAGHEQAGMKATLIVR